MVLKNNSILKLLKNDEFSAIIMRLTVAKVTQKI